jgi:hypothetical protein
MAFVFEGEYPFAVVVQPPVQNPPFTVGKSAVG